MISIPPVSVPFLVDGMCPVTIVIVQSKQFSVSSSNTENLHFSRFLCLLHVFQFGARWSIFILEFERALQVTFYFFAATKTSILAVFQYFASQFVLSSHNVTNCHFERIVP